MCTIGELITKVGSGVTPRGGEAVYKTEGHPFVRSQNVGLGNLLLDDIAFIDEETHLRQKNTELQFNDVLLNITGASIGRSALVDNMFVLFVLKKILFLHLSVVFYCLIMVRDK